jgi:hypothetical protein
LLSNLEVEVAELTGSNLLRNADGGPGGVGAHLTVPQQDGFTDEVLSRDAFVDVAFMMCLHEGKPFSFTVEVLGISSTSTGASPPAWVVSWWSRIEMRPTSPRAKVATINYANLQVG